MREFLLGAVIGKDEPAGPPLAPVGAWPGVESTYRLGGAGARHELAVTLAAEPHLGLPGPTDSPQQAAGLAAEQAARYRLICSQLDDPSLSVSLRTTLNPDLVLPIDDGPRALRRFAAAAHLFAEAAAAAVPPKLTGIAILGELLDRYGLLAEHLATANADQPLNTLLAGGQPLAMRTGQVEPDTVPSDPSTLAQVAARLRITPERLLEDNRGLRLAPDSAFVLPGIVTLPADTRTPYITRDGDTLAALAMRFGTTAREFVAGNAEATGTLPDGVCVSIEASAEAGPASTETVAGDSFASVCARLVEQDAEITLDAVADALDQAGVMLAAGAVLSCPLAVLGSSRDGATALTGAEVETEHGCPPAAFAAANAAVLGLLQPGVQLSAGGRTVTTAESDTLNAVLGRLASAEGTPSIDELVHVPLFRAGGRALLPPTPVTLTGAGPPPKPAAPAVALIVTLRLQRGGAVGTPPVEQADTAVPAGQDRDGLVEAYLAAGPTIRLATDATDTLWAVSFGADGIASVRIEPSAGGALGPRVLGLRALYPRLMDFGAWIRPVTDHGGLGTPVRQQFHQLDVELWARLFLTDLDRYLSEPLSARLPGTARERLSDVRRRVAAGIADGLAPLLDEPDGAELLSARDALASIARDGLMPAYGTVIAQYRAVAVSPYGRDGLPAARLIGAVELPGRSDLSPSSSRTDLDQPTTTCTFAVTSADPAGATSLSIQPQQVFEALELDSAGGPGVLLRFVRPLTGSYRPETVSAELPPAELPLPLREHPAPPSVAAMTAEPTFTGPGLPTLAEAAQWTAGLSYTHQHAAQDVIAVSWSEPAPPATATVGSLALAEALAGYAAAAPELAELIGPGAQPPDGVDAETARNAAASLAELAAAVATPWTQHWAARDGAAPSAATPTGGYRLRAGYLTQPDGHRLLDRLIVHRSGAEYGWPVISLVGADGQAPLTPGPVTGQIREYLPAEPPPQGPPTFRLEWPGLRGAPHPDARITITAERNAVLPAGPPMSSAFLLVSVAQQLEVTRPSIRWDEELPLTGAGIAEALQNAFDALVGERPTGEHPAGEQPEAIRLRIEVGYAEPVGELHTVLPVLLIPERELTSKLAGDIAANLAAWQQTQQPATAGAQWRIRLAVLSARPDQPPILAFDQLVLPASSS